VKKLIDTLRNIWKIEDLRQRILLTLGLVFIYRVGTYITLPGIDPAALANMKSQGSAGILGLVNLFAGGAFSRASVFALGIMPYISASIAVQLLTMVVPYFQKLQKEGESGRRQINQITRFFTVLVTIFQGMGYVVYLTNVDGDAILISKALFTISTVVVLTTGTLFVMWMGERITDKGLGNGISFCWPFCRNTTVLNTMNKLSGHLYAKYRFSDLCSKMSPGMKPIRLVDYNTIVKNVSREMFVTTNV
jgi:preprotein translocase subunit SecY